jgi:hypothetical protein
VETINPCSFHRHLTNNLKALYYWWVKISPELVKIYQQLRWMEQRRKRIVDSVASHFSKKSVFQILEKENLTTCPYQLDLELSKLIDEREPEDFLIDLANTIEFLEAKTITCLRKHTSVYQNHVDEQILFGSRNSGQDAGRQFLATFKKYDKTAYHLEPIESVQAVFDITFNGFTKDKNFFLVLRAQGGSTIHFERSPHLKNWQNAGADPKFLHLVRVEWIKGILDILSSKLAFTYTQSIECGADFGLAQFYSPNIHAAP